MKELKKDIIKEIDELRALICEDSLTNIFPHDYKDIFNHNVYGIHIKKNNDALSEDRPHICIGWSGMGNLSDLDTKETISKRHIDIYPDAAPNSRGQDVGQINRFKNEAQIGDYVVFAERKVCHIGRITSDYYYDNAQYPNQDDDYVNVRNVEWLKTDIDRRELSYAFHKSLGAGMSFWGMNDYKSAVNELLLGRYVKDETDDECDILTYEELEKELKRWVEEEIVATDMARLTAFGFKYAESIREIKNCPKKLMEAIGKSTNESPYMNCGMNTYFAIKNREIDVPLFNTAKEDCYVESFDYAITKGDATNKIFYGVPGCGKSYHIEYNILGKDKETKEFTGDYEEENIIRTTFYQDYSNTDFVGQILPKITKNDKGEDVVEYIFNPGPFTKAFVQAVSNPTKKVALVVEEINRGNAPAIFGDIFQLLDRDENGISEYGIKNVSMMDYLNDLTFNDDGEKIHYIFNDIKIPGNLYIYATMNTSDQNVYTLDTAFTRRWNKERIPNKFGTQAIKDMLVPGLDNVKWETFVNVINDTIRNKIDELQVNEDKQIGIFFVKESDLIDINNLVAENDKTETFAYKVLEYLWDDVTKLDHSVIFKTSYKTFTQLMEDYIERKSIVFNNDIANKLGIIQSESTN